MSDHTSLADDSEGTFASCPRPDRALGPLGSPFDTLLRFLGGATPLSAEDEIAVRDLPVTVRSFEADGAILHEGSLSTYCRLVVEGWCCCYQTLSDGKRQILSVQVPGDLPDFQSLHLPEPDFGIGALAPSVIAFVPAVRLRALLVSRPKVAAAFSRQSYIAAAIQRTWMTGLGRRSALGRVAHLICTLYLRLNAIGLAYGHVLPMPIRQNDLADVLGLTPVHVNRVMRALRRGELIELQNRMVTILDWSALCKVAKFDPRYLHMPKIR